MFRSQPSTEVALGNRNWTAKHFPRSSSMDKTDSEKKNEEFTYEALENQDSSCIYAEASFGNSAESNHIYDIYNTIDDRPHGESVAQNRESSFYHELGPDTVTDEGDWNNEDNIYHVLEEKVEYYKFGHIEDEVW